jgi:hypothetical protein
MKCKEILKNIILVSTVLFASTLELKAQRGVSLGSEGIAIKNLNQKHKVFFFRVEPAWYFGDLIIQPNMQELVWELHLNHLPTFGNSIEVIICVFLLG